MHCLIYLFCARYILVLFFKFGVLQWLQKAGVLDPHAWDLLQNPKWPPRGQKIAEGVPKGVELLVNE